MTVVSIYRHVDHELCRKCPHDETCGQVCFALECLVQLAFEQKALKRLEMIDNVMDSLDLVNSFKGGDDSERQEKR